MEFRDMILWNGMIHFAMLASLLLFANVLRRKIGFLRKSLMPTAVIAGFIGLAGKEVIASRYFSSNQILETNAYLSMITYHAIALGFIALGLKVREEYRIKTKKSQSIYSGLLIVSTYLLQGVLGLAIAITLSLTIFPNLFMASGMLVPLGFGQGPGQALNIGTVYQLSHGFQGGASFGLAIASFGFIWAAIAGVIYLNVLNRKGIINKTPNQKASYVSNQVIESPDEIPLSEAIDKFTIQVSLVLLVYFITYGFMRLIDYLMMQEVFGDFGINTIIPLIWGFNFIFGMLFAIAAKKLFLWLRSKRIMTRQYPNNYMLNRISGFVFDFMIVASITAIRIEDLNQLWGPFIIMVILIGLATLFYIHKMAARIYPEYKSAATMGMFGMLTGTASTGVVLLREVDPNFETPAANDLVIGSTTAILFGFPILLLVGIAPISPLHTWATFGIVIVLFIIALSILLFFNKKTPPEGRSK